MGDAKTISQLSGEMVGGAKWATPKLYPNCREKGLGCRSATPKLYPNCREKGLGCQMGNAKTISQLSGEMVGVPDG